MKKVYKQNYEEKYLYSIEKKNYFFLKAIANLFFNFQGKKIFLNAIVKH